MILTALAIFLSTLLILLIAKSALYYIQQNNLRKEDMNGATMYELYKNHINNGASLDFKNLRPSSYIFTKIMISFLM